MSIGLIVFGLALFAGPFEPIQEERDAPDVQERTHTQLARELSALVAHHPKLATRHQIGMSREGRELYALRITAAKEPELQPAILLIANLEGPRVFESGVATHHARKLLGDYATSKEVKELLDSTVIWVIPRPNPDAAEARFQEPRFERWNANRGIDNDRDGRMGEDPPSDVNGDGFVTQMRVLDPDGEWMEDPTDARIMIRADVTKGERGKWKIYPESRDLDGDEEPGEDPPGDTRTDKNFASGWTEHTAEAGLFPTDEPEARALCEFVMAQKNLVLVVAYDGQDNLVKKPESVGDDARPVMRIPPEGVLESDADLIEELGSRYKKATENETEGSGEDGGTFTRWCYDHRGLYVLQAVLWSMPDEAPEEEEAEEAAEEEESAEEEEGDDDSAEMKEEEKAEPSDDAKHMLWVDGAEETWRFLDWKVFDHPELGEVEIGGFAPYARLVPPDDEIQAIADTHFDWFVGLQDLAPRLALSTCTKEKKGEGVWEVKAVVSNTGYLPLLSRSMQRTRTTRPAKVQLRLPDAGTLLSGSKQALIRELEGSGGRFELTWLIHGPEDMEIGVSVDSDHAGEAFEVAEIIQ